MYHGGWDGIIGPNVMGWDSELFRKNRSIPVVRFFLSAGKAREAGGALCRGAAYATCGSTLNCSIYVCAKFCFSDAKGTDPTYD